MENKDLYHFVNQIEQFWDYYPIEVFENKNVEDNVVLQVENNNKQDLNYF